MMKYEYNKLMVLYGCNEYLNGKIVRLIGIASQFPTGLVLICELPSPIQTPDGIVSAINLPDYYLKEKR